MYKAYDKDKNVLALKCIEIQEDLTEEDIVYEISVCATLCNEFIIPFVDGFVSGDKAYLITTYCENGSLRQLLDLKESKKEKFSESELVSFTSSLLTALSYIQIKNVVHRDIKPENIFLSNNKENLLLGDFGISKLFDPKILISTFVGTPLYMAPEVLLGKEYTNKIDNWSLGCTLYEIYYFKHPFKVNSIPELITKQKLKLDFPFIPYYFKRIIESLIVYDPDKRKDVDTILNQLYFSLYGLNK